MFMSDDSYLGYKKMIFSSPQNKLKDVSKTYIDISNWQKFELLLYFQGKGLGTMLLDFAESLAREVEVEVVSIRDDLLAMYRKRGYKEISTLPITTRVPADQLTRPEVKLILMVKKEKE